MLLKFIVIGIFLIGASEVPASAASNCPGNPGALGTARTLVVDPVEHPRIGTMQYPETLPLEDHEVVLTFDDGPIHPHTGAVLDILAAQCVKATFFMVGRMAQEMPELVRRVRDEGHTIGTHSQNHPFRFGEMPADRIKSEIEDGITNVSSALGDTTAVAPFFRVPGLRRAEGVETYLAERGIMIWSADLLADDWRHISSTQVIRLALSRLEAKGKGVLLLHDIQERTQVALPAILHEFKIRGYRIVHVVPATAQRPKTVTDLQQWFLQVRSDQTPMAKMSIRSVWLAHAPTPRRASASVLEPPPSADFLPDDTANRSQPHMQMPSKTTSHVRLPGSWPIAPAGMTLKSLPASIANADQTRATEHQVK